MNFQGLSFIDKITSPLIQWLDTLESRERKIVIIGLISLLFIIFYLAIWDPIISKYEQQSLKHKSQTQLYSWMKNASAEIQSYRSSGSTSANRYRNQSISSLADRSARTTGVKRFISKIDQNKSGVKVTLQAANFDAIVYWLADLKQKYAINTSSVKIERTKIAGTVNATITLERAL